MYRVFYIICKSTNEHTIIIYIQINRLLRVSTPNVSSSGACFHYLAKIHKYNCRRAAIVLMYFGLIIYISIIIVLSLVDLQIN